MYLRQQLFARVFVLLLFQHIIHNKNVQNHVTFKEIIIIFQIILYHFFLRSVSMSVFTHFSFSYVLSTPFCSECVFPNNFMEIEILSFSLHNSFTFFSLHITIQNNTGHLKKKNFNLVLFLTFSLSFLWELFLLDLAGWQSILWYSLTICVEGNFRFSSTKFSFKDLILPFFLFQMYC